MMNPRKSPHIDASLSDEELVRLAYKGEQEAFDLLYKRHLPNVMGRVRLKIPENDVEDVTQEIFIAVLRSLDRFKGQSKFSTWVWTITNHKIVDYYRHHKHNLIEQDEYEEAVTQDSSEYATDVNNPQSDLDAVRQALCALPQSYQDILLMRFVDEMPFNEIAEHNKQSLEATRSLFRRSVAALGKKLEGSNE
jgi:RNA polymerase sigma-70 factor (ECF subfamily)